MARRNQAHVRYMKSGVGKHSNAPCPSRDTRTHWSRNSFLFPSPVSVALSNLIHAIYIYIRNYKEVRHYLLIYLLTYSMEQSPPWEANWFSGSQEIPPLILWNPMVHYRIHKCPQPVPILSLINKFHSHFLNIHFNIILPSTPGSSKWSVSLRFPHQNPVCTSSLPHTCYMRRPSHSSRFHNPNNIWWRLQISKFLIT
jgi:hypothetical protein